MYEDRDRLRSLMAEEVAEFEARRPRSRAEWERASQHLPGGVLAPGTAGWSPWPVTVASAYGAHFIDVDGIDHVDLCLGDTGAMSGHAPQPVVTALAEQLEHGSTFLLPTRKAGQAGTLLAERFGLPMWRFVRSGADANRTVLRAARRITGRSRVVVHDHGGHGAVGDASATLVVPFNDIDALAGALRAGEVAAVLIEPALTNAGIVLPEPHYLGEVRELCTRAGAILVHDESRTISAGPGGVTARDGLSPDAVTLGEAIAGGVAAGALGMTAELAGRIGAAAGNEGPDGLDGASGGSALSLAGIVATLGEVLRPEAYEGMNARAAEWIAGVRSAIDEFGAPWHATQLGARAAYSFRPVPPRDGREAADAEDAELSRYLHLHALNRGILLSPSHRAALMSPSTAVDDVERHTVAFREALAALFASAIERPAPPGVA